MKKTMIMLVTLIAIISLPSFAGPMARMGDTEYAYLQVNDGYDWLYDYALFRNWYDGAVAYLCDDFWDYKDGSWGSLGTGLPMTIGEGVSVTFDFDGHSLTHRQGGSFVFDSGSVTFRNGAIYQLSGGTIADFSISGSNVNVVFGDNFEFMDVHGDEHNGYIDTLIQAGNVSNCNVVVDGARIQTTYFYNFETVGEAFSFYVKGSSQMHFNYGWYWWGQGNDNFHVYMQGGWYNLNPTTCGRAVFSDNYFILDFGEDYGAHPERYRLFDNFNGWTFDSNRDAELVFPAVSFNAPGGPISVTLKGTMPTENVMLADLSAATINGDISFESATDGVKVSYRDGKLYAAPNKISFLIFLR